MILCLMQSICTVRMAFLCHSFWTSIFFRLKSQKNYSDEYALSLLNEQEVEKVETPEELPDIIAIMDETFSDPAVLGEFETNKDYMPFVHSILRGEVANTISGYTDCFCSWRKYSKL